LVFFLKKCKGGGILLTLQTVPLAIIELQMMVGL